MFSPKLEMIWNVAFREADSRRHAHLTLEHVLYAIANDPKGEEILVACGADVELLRQDLKRYLPCPNPLALISDGSPDCLYRVNYLLPRRFPERSGRQRLNFR